jgi:hypothetical protein
MVGRYGSTQNNAISLLGVSEKEAYVQLLLANVEVGYKNYPLLPHQDPSSPEYIHSELDEYHDSTDVQ